jgi:hypothetical protein
MIKKLRSFSFLSFLIFAGHESLAVEYQNKYQRKNFYKNAEKECVCSCHDSRAFCGLQIFGSGSLVLDYKNFEISAARFIHPNLYYFFNAYQENKSQSLKKNKKIPNYYEECFAAQPTLGKHWGWNIGLRYLWGSHKSGYGVTIMGGKRNLFKLTLKSEVEKTMVDGLRKNGIDETDIQTIRKVREKQENKTGQGDQFYAIPESISCSTWHVDVLFELYRCFIGDMLKTQFQQRKSFCLLGFVGFGMRLPFLTKVVDNIYSVAPKENAAFVQKNKLSICPLIKLGLQGIFKNGCFIELDLLAQMLYLPYLCPIPVPCSTFGIKNIASIFYDVKKKNDFWFLLNVNPEIKISFGYDFYGLCVGEKLEDYYDN